MSDVQKVKTIHQHQTLEFEPHDQIEIGTLE
jgi:hypothetical protein